MSPVEKKDVDLKFGRLLAQIRKRGRLSQKDFAAAVGLSRASIANIESGKHGVQLSFVFRAAEILGVSVDELIPDLEPGADGTTLEVQKFLNAVNEFVARS